MNMKRIVFFPCAALVTLLAGCAMLQPVMGSGTLTRSSYPAAGFGGIQASQSFLVRIVPDSVYSVNVTCDDNVLRYLIVESPGGGTLNLSLMSGYNYTGVTLIAEVHMPTPSVIEASGASTVKIDSPIAPIQGLRLVLSGASTCEIAHLAGGDLSMDLKGASQATVTGSAGAMTLNVTGASQANVLNCTGTRATVSLGGASQAWVDVGTHPIDLSASGASTLYYGGNPALVTHELSGGSRIVKVR
jgi:hypothetical protein